MSPNVHIDLWHTDGSSCEGVEDFETKNVLTPNLRIQADFSTIELLVPDISHFLFWNTVSGDLDILSEKLTFKTSTVYR